MNKLEIIKIGKNLKGSLNKALLLASIYHDGIYDKGGNNYINHPLKVRALLDKKEEEIETVAILHDIIEDTEITKEDLFDIGLSINIVNAIISLSRKENESYMDFIKRVSENEIATYVKLADLRNNMDLSRIDNPSIKDYERNKKYKKAYNLLLMKI